MGNIRLMTAYLVVNSLLPLVGVDFGIINPKTHTLCRVGKVMKFRTGRDFLFPFDQIFRGIFGKFGGRGGIRTLGGFNTTAAFQATALNRYATRPEFRSPEGKDSDNRRCPAPGKAGFLRGINGVEYRPVTGDGLK